MPHKKTLNKILLNMTQPIAQRYCDWFLEKITTLPAGELMEDDAWLWERFAIDEEKFLNKYKQE